MVFPLKRDVAPPNFESIAQFNRFVPGSKGLRVVFNAKFLASDSNQSGPTTDTKAESNARRRELVVLARDEAPGTCTQPLLWFPDPD